MAMIKCKNCGANVSDTANWCPNCGSQIIAMQNTQTQNQIYSQMPQNYTKTKNCKYCNRQIPYTIQACTYCGKKQKSQLFEKFFVLLLVILPFFLAVVALKNIKKPVSNPNKQENITESDENKETTAENRPSESITKPEDKEPEKNELNKNIFDEEIIFKDIPWGTSFSEVDNMLSQLNLWNITGEDYKTYSVDDILIGDYEGIDFDYNDINVISRAFNGEQDVAGYTTSEIHLYFAFIPENGYLTYNEGDSVLYGAQYVFEPTDLESMYEDLSKKLIGIYGEPYKISEDSDIWGNKYTYTYWLGANDTELVLRATDSSGDTTNLYHDEIFISYAWRYGDTLLQNASDAIKKEKLDAEREAQENGNNDGL